MRRKIKEKLIFILLFVFFTHGVFFYFYPGAMYESIWVKYVKYVVFMLYFVVTISNVNALKLLIVSFIMMSFVILSNIGHSYVLTDNYISLLNFYCPFLLLSNNYRLPFNMIKKLVVSVAWFAVIAAFFEYCFLQEIMIFNNHLSNGGYYRVISIFFNPNGCGLLFLLFVIFLVTFMRPLSVKNYILIVLSAIVVVMAGSKTAFLFGLAYCSILMFLKFVVKRTISFRILAQLFIFFWGVIFLYLILTSSFLSDLFSIREYQVDTVDTRLERYMKFVSMIEHEFWFPERNMPFATNDLTADSSYLALWGDFGFIGMLIYLSVIILFLLYGKKIFILKMTFILTLILVAASVRIFYTWPLSYVFFYVLSMRTEMPERNEC